MRELRPAAESSEAETRPLAETFGFPGYGPHSSDSLCPVGRGCACCSKIAESWNIQDPGFIGDSQRQTVFLFQWPSQLVNGLLAD